MRKRFVSLFLVLCMLVSYVSVPVLADEEDETSSRLSVTLDGTTLGEGGTIIVEPNYTMTLSITGTLDSSVSSTITVELPKGMQFVSLMDEQNIGAGNGATSYETSLTDAYTAYSNGALGYGTVTFTMNTTTMPSLTISVMADARYYNRNQDTSGMTISDAIKVTLSSGDDISETVTQDLNVYYKLTGTSTWQSTSTSSATIGGTTTITHRYWTKLFSLESNNPATIYSLTVYFHVTTGTTISKATADSSGAYEYTLTKLTEKPSEDTSSAAYDFNSYDYYVGTVNFDTDSDGFGVTITGNQSTSYIRYTLDFSDTTSYSSGDQVKVISSGAYITYNGATSDESDRYTYSLFGTITHTITLINEDDVLIKVSGQTSSVKDYTYNGNSTHDYTDYNYKLADFSVYNQSAGGVDDLVIEFNLDTTSTGKAHFNAVVIPSVDKPESVTLTFSDGTECSVDIDDSSQIAQFVSTSTRVSWIVYVDNVLSSAETESSDSDEEDENVYVTKAVATGCSMTAGYGFNSTTVSAGALGYLIPTYEAVSSSYTISSSLTIYETSDDDEEETESTEETDDGTESSNLTQAATATTTTTVNPNSSTVTFSSGGYGSTMELSSTSVSAGDTFTISATYSSYGYGVFMCTDPVIYVAVPTGFELDLNKTTLVNSSDSSTVSYASTQITSNTATELPDGWKLYKLTPENGAVVGYYNGSYKVNNLKITVTYNITSEAEIGSYDAGDMLFVGSDTMSLGSETAYGATTKVWSGDSMDFDVTKKETVYVETSAKLESEENWYTYEDGDENTKAVITPGDSFQVKLEVENSTNGTASNVLIYLPIPQVGSSAGAAFMEDENSTFGFTLSFDSDTGIESNESSLGESGSTLTVTAGYADSLNSGIASDVTFSESSSDSSATPNMIKISVESMEADEVITLVLNFTADEDGEPDTENIYNTLACYTMSSGSTVAVESSKICALLRNGTLSGVVFEDEDFSKSQSESEPGVEGITVTAVEQYEDGTEGRTYTATTDEDGKYEITGLSKKYDLNLTFDNSAGPVSTVSGALRYQELSEYSGTGWTVTIDTDDTGELSINGVSMSSGSATVNAGVIYPSTITFTDLTEDGATALITPSSASVFYGDTISTGVSSIQVASMLTGLSFNGTWVLKTESDEDDDAEDDSAGTITTDNLMNVVVTGDATYIAQMETASYSVKFYAWSDGEVALVKTVEVEYNGTVSSDDIPDLTSYTREGYTATNWALNGVYDESSLMDSDAIAAAYVVSDTIYIAYYVANNSSVTLNANGGSFTDNATTLTLSGVYGNVVNTATGYEEPTRTGYVFAGWGNSSTASSYEEVITFPAEATTYYAVWEEDTAESVTFVANGGTVTNDASLKVSGLVGDEVTVPELSRSGWTFDGWYTSADFSGDAVTFTDGKTTIGETSVVYYAKWTGAMSISSIADETYTGSQLTPELTVTIPSSTDDETMTLSSENYVAVYGTNTDVGTGTVTVYGIGDYLGLEATAEFNIVKASQTLTFSESSISVTYSEGLKVTNVATAALDSANATVTYTSGDTSVATVDDSTGEVTILKAGSVTITATSAGTGNVDTATATYTLTIAKATPTLSFENSALSVLATAGSVENTLTTDPGGLTVTYSTSDESVATVDSSTGSVTIKGAGTATITASFAGDDSYEAATASYGLTVSSDTISYSASDYTGVYDGDEHSITVTVDSGVSGASVTYSETYDESGTGYSATSPTRIDVGTTTVYYRITAAGYDTVTGSATVTITAADASLLTVADIETQTYTGSAIEPGVTISYDSSTLTAGTDYTVTYYNNINAGTAIAYVTFTGNYSGSALKTFTIEPKTIESSMISSIDEQSYTGSEVTPSVTVTDGSYTLTEGTDYSVSYSDNVSPGTASVTVTGTGNYTGTATVNFTISDVSDSLTLGVVVDNTSRTYTGSAQEANVLVYVSDGSTKTLLESGYYTVTYSDNTNAGTATVTVSGTGIYAGLTVKGSFVINKADQTVAFSTDESISKTYGDSGFTVTATVTGVDSSVSTPAYSSSDENVVKVDSSTGAVTVVGVGTATITASAAETTNYNAGSDSCTVTVSAKSIADSTVTVTGVSESYTWTGEEIDIEVTVSDSATLATLVKDTDYSVTITANTDLGTGTVTITGLGNYTNSRTLTFSINADSLTVSVADSSVTYTGGEQEPDVTVTYGSTTLSESDYAVTYEDNVNVGTATVTVYGIGTYAGLSGTATFSIVKGEQTLTFALGSEVSATYGDDAVTNVASASLDSSNVAITYSSSDTSIASVDSSTGAVTIVGAGTVKITATASATDNVESTTATYTLTVGEAEPEISYLKTAISIPTTETVENTLTVTPSTLSVTYSSSDTNVATVDSSSGSITIVGEGETTITATTTEGSSYSSASASFVLFVSNSSISYSASGYSGTYDGDTHGITVSSTVDGATVTYGSSEDSVTDSTSPTYSDVGVYTVYYKITASGYDDVTGSAVVEIKAKSVSGLTASAADATYTGESLTTTVTVTDGETTLTEGTDYSLVYSNNTNAGTATATVIGTGNYTGTATTTFTIGQKSLTSDMVSTINAQTYNGSALTPSVTLKDGSYTLIEGYDYTVSYSGNTSVGTATVTITGTGNYTGTVTTTFTITNESTLQVTVSESSFTYDGTAHEATVVVYSQDTDGTITVLTSGTDYSVSYSDNTNAGTATVTVTGSGNYNGKSATGTFTISKAEQTLTLSPTEKSVTYGDESFAITASSTGVASDSITTTYTYESSDTSVVTVDSGGNVTIVGAGTTTITVTAAATDNYESASAVCTVTVSAKSITDSTITVSGVSDSYSYTGSQITPNVTVTDGETTLTADTDYTVSYGTNIAIGTNNGTVTVTGTGNYTGTVTKYFDITDSNISVSVTDSDIVYDGTAKTPSVTVSFGDDTLSASDYVVQYSDNVEAGTAKVTVMTNTGLTGSTTFTISKGEQTLTFALGDSVSATYGDSTVTNVASASLDSSNVTITYSSSNTNIVSVDSSTGAVTIVGAGNVTITATASETSNVNGTTATYTLTVGEAEPEISYEKTAISIPTTGSVDNTLTVSPSSLSVTYTSSDTSVATVDSSGNVTVAGSGETTITATTTATENYSSASTSFVLFVSNSSISYSASGYSGTYDGDTHGITVSSTVEGATVTYGSSEDSITESTSPTYSDVGVYTVYYKITASGYDDVTGSAVVEIKAKSVSGLTATATDATYTGSEISTTVTVTDGETTLTEGTDYSLVYSNNTNAGTATVTVIGTGNYTGTATTTFTISQKSLTDDMVSTINAQTYTGSTITPSVTVTDGSYTLIEGYDYTVSYSSNTSVGTATVTITGTGNYTGTVTTTFTITNESTLQVTVSESAFTYDGTAKEANVIVYVTGSDGSYSVLTAGTDYAVSYSDNTNAGTATVTVTGSGNYSGKSATGIFTISKAEQSLILSPENKSVTYGDESFAITASSTGVNNDAVTTTYTYESSDTSVVTVDSGGSVTIAGAGTATITVTAAATDNYESASAVCTVTVEPKEITSSMVSTSTSESYTGSQITPSVTVTDGETTLTADTDYTVSYGTNIAIGTSNGTVTVTGTGNYTGTVTKYFDITDSNITVSVTDSDIVYDGAAKTPSVTVSFGDDTLSASDYVVQYSDNVEAGTATVTVYGIGTYAGLSGTATFTIAKGEQTLTFALGDSVSATYGDGTVTNVASAALDSSNVTITYSSGNTSVATVDSSTGAVTIVGAGTVTIKATASETSNVNTATATYTLTIGEAEPEISYSKTAISIPTTGSVENTLTVTPSTLSVTYTSSDTSVATVDSSGNVTVVGSGETTITATTTATDNYSSASASFVLLVSNSSISYSASGYSGTYDGDTHSITVTSTVDGASVTYGTSEDSITESSSPTYTNVGVYTVYYKITASGYDDVTGSAVVEIKAKSVSGLTASAADATYTGSEISTTVTVTDGDTTLTEGTDYSLVYSNNTNAGTATVTVIGTGNYTGTATTTFTISSKSLTSDMVSTINDQTYTGSALTPSVTVTDGSYTLIEGYDYTVSYSGNTSVGTATVTITGTGNYTGTVTTTFTITNKSTLQVTVSESSFTYDGTAKEASVIVYVTDSDGSYSVLTSGTDYTVSYTDNTNAGTATVTVTGTGNYDGKSATGTFTISKAEQTLTLSETAKTVTYGDESFAITASSTGVASDTVTTTYTYESSDTGVVTVDTSGSVTIVGAGTATVTVTAAATDNYESASATCTVTVEPKEITSSMVSTSTSESYTGSQIAPSVTVTDGETTLIADTDYTVSYGTNIAIGTNNGTVTVTGTGNYTGTVTKYFDITDSNISVSVTDSDIVYDGTAKTPSVTVSFGDDTLSASDYVVQYSDNVEAGTAKVTVMTNTGLTGSATFTISKGEQTLTFALGDSVSVTYGDGTVTNTASAALDSSNVTITYSSGNTGVATVDSSTGAVTIVGAGTVTITATASATDNVNSGTATYTLTIGEAEPEISYEKTAISIPTTGTVENTLTVSPSSLSVTYTSSDTSVATVDESGNVTVAGSGETTITATTTATDNYSSASASFVLFVSNSSISYSASGYSGTYDGDSHGITVTSTVDGASVTYGTSEDSVEDSSSPTYTDVGVYTVYYRITASGYDDVTGSAVVEIKAKSVSGLTASAEDTTYTGESLTTTVTVTDGTTTLTESTDYSLVYSNNTNAGTATVTVIGTGNYTGTTTTTFTIGQKSLTESMVSTINAQTYTGSALTPSVTETDGSYTLIEGYDYTASYSDNTSVGTATVTITGTGNYTGTVTTTFTITNESTLQVTVSESSFTYDGTAHEATVVVYSQDTDGTITVLTSGTDYSVSYSDNTNAGTATVTVAGSGNYDGKSATGTFTISKAEQALTLSPTEKSVTYGDESFAITASSTGVNNDAVTTTYTYESSDTSVVTVDSGGNVTIVGAGTTTVTVTAAATDNYESASAVCTVTVEPKEITDGTVSVESVDDQVYTGSEIEPRVTVTDDDEDLSDDALTLTENVDYELSYSENTDVGTATITITGIGNYTGERDIEFSIVAQTYGFGLSTVEDQTYTGYEITVDIVVTFEGETLTEGVDYEIEFYNNVNAGTATVIITGIGSYEGIAIAEITFTINPKSIASASVTTSSTVSYDGEEQTPAVTVEDGNVTLVENTDYTVSYSDNVSLGLATVTVTGIGNYTGTAAATFAIVADELVVTTVDEVTYDGSAQEPEVEVTCNGVTLSSSDYTVEYEDNIDVGTATVTVYGKNDYDSMTATATFEIVKAEQTLTFVLGDELEVEWEENLQVLNVAYVTMEPDEVEIVWTSSDEEVATVDEDGLVTVLNTGEVIITAEAMETNNVEGTEESYTLTITSADPILYFEQSEVSVLTTSSVENGLLNPYSLTVTYMSSDESVATVDEDGIVTVLSEGETVITATFEGNECYNSTYAEFRLIVSNDSIIYSAHNYYGAYDGSEHTIEVNVTTPATGYTVLYSEEENGEYEESAPSYSEVGAYTVYYTITADDYDNIMGSAEVRIWQRSLGELDVEEISDQTYTGSEITPEITITCEGVMLEEGTDYTVVYSGNNTDTGTVTVLILGTGDNYDNWTVATFNIVAKDVSDSTIEIVEIANQAWTGSEVEPEVTVYDSEKGETLTQDVDYTVEYTDNVDVGTATVKITGIGNYTGEIEVSFEIVMTYTVTYTDGADGKAFEDQVYDGLEAGAETPGFDGTPTRSGYTFTSWDPEVADTVTGDVTYTAQWKKSSTSSSSGSSSSSSTTDTEEDSSGSTVPSVLNGDDHYAYIIGYSDGTVRPTGNTTRAEVATILFRLLKDDVRAEYETMENNFTDVGEDDWFNTAVSTLAAMGVLVGRSDTEFDPNANITRAEVAVIFARLDDSGVTGDAVTFNDISGHWAEDKIEQIASLGWILGDGDGTFRPDDYITRAEVMAIINRVLGRKVESGEDLLDSMRTWSDNLPGMWYYLAIQEATNSHTYKDTDDGYERWTAIVDDPDWTEYE